MSNAPMLHRAIVWIACLLVSSYFMWHAYEVFRHKESFASSFYSAYGNFEEWWNKSIKAFFTCPPQRSLYPYKLKLAMFFGYFYVLGSVLTLIG